MPTSTKRTTKRASKSNVPVNNGTVGEYLLNSLHKLGVEHIFGVPGDYVLRLDKLIEKHPIKLINTTRENTAGYLADAYARFHGLGVACITYGVGINITNAISQAFVESSPLVVISGAAGKDEWGRCPYLHHMFNKASSAHSDPTQLEIFKHITIDQAVLDDPNTAADEIDRVLDACLWHKKPVYIEIPRDCVDALIPEHVPEQIVHVESDQGTLDEALNDVIAILKNSTKPLIWVGHEIQRFGLVPQVLKFAEKYHIPIVSTLLGKTTISEYHPLFVGLYLGELSRDEVREFVEESDCALLLGVMLTDMDTGNFTEDLAHENKIIANADSITIRHHHYPKLQLSDFMDGLADLNLNIQYRAHYPASIDREIPKFTAKKDKKITSERVFECIQSHLKPENIVVSDIGDCLFGSADLLLEQNSYLSNAYFGSLGFGIPGALGTQFAQPKKRPIAIVGDGAFQMTASELSTAVRYKLDPVVIVLNNHGYGTERPILDGEYNDIVNWNYHKLPELLGGGQGFKVKTETELDQALTKALAKRGTFTIIEVELNKNDFSPTLKRFMELLHSKKEES